MTGITARANQLGFNVEHFILGPHGVRLDRLDTILHTRGIQGLVLLPALGFPDLTALSWHRYTAVYADQFIDRPPPHCVCSDHYRSTIAPLRELYARGYRRPGLFIEIALSERLQFRREGAFLALQKYLPDITEVPTLRLQEVACGGFEPWVKKYNPDVVLGHYPEAMAWMKDCGARFQNHGFVCLNLLRTVGNCVAHALFPEECGECVQIL